MTSAPFNLDATAISDWLDHFGGWGAGRCTGVSLSFDGQSGATVSTVLIYQVTEKEKESGEEKRGEKRGQKKGGWEGEGRRERRRGEERMDRGEEKRGHESRRMVSF